MRQTTTFPAAPRHPLALRRALLAVALGGACLPALAQPAPGTMSAAGAPSAAADTGTQAFRPAPDVDLLVQHTIVSAGADGVKRTAEFSENVVRRGEQVWVERVVPAGWHSEAEHGHHDAGHRHLDVTAASRWITRDARTGRPQLRLAAGHDRVLVEVAPTDWGNVGFDGSWPAAYHLIDPAVLERLRVTRTAGDLITYTSAAPAAGQRGTLTVVWNRRLQVPALVESREGPSYRRTVVQVRRPGATAPWDAVRGYQKKDYADFLD